MISISKFQKGRPELAVSVFADEVVSVKQDKALEVFVHFLCAESTIELAGPDRLFISTPRDHFFLFTRADGARDMECLFKVALWYIFCTGRCLPEARDFIEKNVIRGNDATDYRVPLLRSVFPQ